MPSPVNSFNSTYQLAASSSPTGQLRKNIGQPQPNFGYIPVACEIGCACCAAPLLVGGALISKKFRETLIFGPPRAATWILRKPWQMFLDSQTGQSVLEKARNPEAAHHSLYRNLVKTLDLILFVKKEERKAHIPD
jgi:hypothetical protein